MAASTLPVRKPFGVFGVAWVVGAVVAIACVAAELVALGLGILIGASILLGLFDQALRRLPIRSSSRILQMSSGELWTRTVVVVVGYVFIGLLVLHVGHAHAAAVFFAGISFSLALALAALAAAAALLRQRVRDLGPTNP